MTRNERDESRRPQKRAIRRPGQHLARFPGRSNDPETHALTARQAARLESLSALPKADLVGKTLPDLRERLGKLGNLQELLFRRLCGRVVKRDAEGNELPVPFATVTVYDTDINLIAWSPAGQPHSWFYPFGVTREVLAQVTTDECGRFCVWLPRFDIDHYLRWRLERRCYLEWLRVPVIEDVLFERDPIPDPIGPVAKLGLQVRELDGAALRRAEHRLDPVRSARLRDVASRRGVGSLRAELDDELRRPAFDRLPPPLDARAKAILDPKMRAKLAARAGVSPRKLVDFDAKRVFGPFLRCKWVAVPEWTTIVDIPDLSFEVTQDVNGDGQQTPIYTEGLFDVRWDAGDLGEVVLVAEPTAIAGPSCDLPELGPCGDPAILFAGNYPLQVPGNPSETHDAGSGYAKLPNRPDADGIPGGAAVEPGETPFVGSFYLVGCAEREGATHYRVHREVNGTQGYLQGAYGPLSRVVGGVLQTRTITPVDGHWYPIVGRDEGWTPVGILAPVPDQAGVSTQGFELEFGALAGGTVTPIPNSKTGSINLRFDATKPTITVHSLHWRHPGGGWNALDPDDCAVVPRQGTQAVQVRVSFSVSANHLRNYWASASGCGPQATISQITQGAGDIPAAAPDSAAHWHTSPSDNALSRTLYYQIDAGADAGCYHVAIAAASRSFRPTYLPSNWRGHDPQHLWRQRVLRIAVQ